MKAEEDTRPYSVYWIHLRGAVDIYREGYVGVTVEIQRRWDRHRMHANELHSKRNGFPLYKAFRRYGLALFEFEVVADGLDKWSAHNLEFALRPRHHIGLNLEPGGFYASAFKVCSLSPLYPRALSEGDICQHPQVPPQRYWQRRASC